MDGETSAKDPPCLISFRRRRTGVKLESQASVIDQSRAAAPQKPPLFIEGVAILEIPKIITVVTIPRFP